MNGIQFNSSFIIHHSKFILHNLEFRIQKEFKMLVIPPPQLRGKKKPALVTVPPSTPVQSGLTILSVVRTGSSTYTVTFSNPPTLSSGPVPNGGFAVNGQPPSSVSGPYGNQISVSFATAGSGLPWTVTAQPNWLGVPIAFPQSGVTS